MHLRNGLLAVSPAESMTAAIVGGIIGGTLIVIVVILGVVFVKRKTLQNSPKGKQSFKNSLM